MLCDEFMFCSVFLTYVMTSSVELPDLTIKC